MSKFFKIIHGFEPERLYHQKYHLRTIKLIKDVYLNPLHLLTLNQVNVGQCLSFVDMVHKRGVQIPDQMQTPKSKRN